jgi:hypothetical protein
VAALCLLCTALMRYTSSADRRILARWSVLHSGLILVVLILLGVVLYRWWAARRSATAGPGGWGTLGGALGFLAWSAGFAIDSLEDAATGGRLGDLRLFSSTAPMPIVLEWVAMLLLSSALLARLVWGRAARATPPRRARWAGNLLVVGVSVVLSVLLLEGALRFVSLLVPEVQGFPTRAQALWTRRFVRLNTLGYRDDERIPDARPGVTRILLVGDSFAYGMGINDPEERVGDLLEVALNRAVGAPRFEVVQGAVPNTHTLHHIAALRRLLVFRPRYALLLYVFNDIAHVARPANGARPRLGPLWRVLLQNSVAAEQVFVRLRAASYARFGTTAADPYADPALLAEHLRAVAEFIGIARDAGVEARLVPVDLTVRLEARFLERYRRFERAAVAHGIPVWSLERAFDDHAWSELVVNRLDNHPNELSNALMARAIAERFHAEFLPPLRRN